MAASACILHSSYRRSTTSLPLYHLPRLSRQSVSSPHRFPSLSLNHHSSKFPSFNPPFSAPPNFSISATRLLLGHQNSSFRWNFAHGAIPTDHRNSIGASHTDSEVAVVILGWLGAKPKHLRRYVEMYNARGIHAVTFVASVMDVLSFDLGRKLEERVRSLADELAAWLSDHVGRDRILIFHTFSNTGWLAYGAILDNLKDRQDLLDKIKGCVVDSGGDPDIDPKPPFLTIWGGGTTKLIEPVALSPQPVDYHLPEIAESPK